MIHPSVQEYFDKRAFDPVNGYEVITPKQQKVRHINLHIAKAAMKLICGSDKQIKAEVLPDTAIYRNQLIGVVGLVDSVLLEEMFPQKQLSVTDNSEELFRASSDAVIEAGGNLATYLERLEHGAPTEDTHILQAAVCLHTASTGLGELYGVDVDLAHIARMEELLKARIPDNILYLRP